VDVADSVNCSQERVSPEFGEASIAEPVPDRSALIFANIPIFRARFSLRERLYQ
jgi:hypothetical protein